jgi:acyl-CoA thioesterase-1
MNRTVLAALLLVFLAVVTVVVKERSGAAPTPERLGPNAVILAFGDSLTSGYGAPKSQSYPAQLRAMTGLEVINAGVPGELSAEGLKRLPSLLETYRPDLVILCHGGNDILRKKPKRQLRSNLVRMIALIRQNGAEVLFVGVPGFGMLGLDTLELYDEIAEESGVVYEGEALSAVLGDPSLKSDQIHPNAQGYGVMSRAFFERLKDSGLLR